MQNGETGGADASDVRSLPRGQRHQVDPITEILLRIRRMYSRTAVEQRNEFPLRQEYGLRTQEAARLPEVQEVHGSVRELRVDHVDGSPPRGEPGTDA